MLRKRITFIFLEKQSSNLQTHFDKIKITEDESNNRLRIVKTESHLAQKRLQNITNIRHQTQQRLISIQKHENTVILYFSELNLLHFESF